MKKWRPPISARSIPRISNTTVAKKAMKLIINRFFVMVGMRNIFFSVICYFVISDNIWFSAQALFTILVQNQRQFEENSVSLPSVSASCGWPLWHWGQYSTRYYFAHSQERRKLYRYKKHGNNMWQANRMKVYLFSFWIAMHTQGVMHPANGTEVPFRRRLLLCAKEHHALFVPWRDW